LSFLAPQPPPGQFLYEPRGNLGEGGLGIVDAVEVIASSCEVRVGSILARKRLNQRWTMNPEAQTRFDREVEVLGAMAHPNIVTLTGVSLPGGERAYLMPLYPDTMRKELLRGVRQPLSIVVDRGIKIAEALAYAHGQGFVHRDVKPDNVLLDASGEPILSDWGLGRFIHKFSTVLDLTKAGVGTEYYCSMEQWVNAPNVDGRTDVYSFGMMLAEMALGQRVTGVRARLGIRADVLPTSVPGAELLNGIVRKMTSVSPSARYGSMAHVAAVLRALAMHI